MTPLAKRTLVRVTWVDAEDQKEAWLTNEEVETFTNQEALVVSLGWVVSHTDQYLTLAADWVAHLEHHGRVTKIANGQVVNVEEL